MKKLVLFITMLSLFMATSLTADAHPGRLDSNGGHKCSDKSKEKGLCSGYHYHNKSSEVTPSTNINQKKPTPQSKPEPVLTTVDVYINNVKQTYNPSAYIKNGTNLVPMKAIFVSLGATVTYDNATKKVTAYKGNKKIDIGVGNKKAYVNSNGVTTTINLNHAAEIYKGTTMVPLRFVSEALGADITFDDAVFITTK
ncbi:copper amine oxidase N-terminal domain-containing protein [Lysinibacillus xylanilyticus]|uniref:stalk domain-containing protein n=1 Tax=Lysinibacillus xylanilyticus TaxID=582475 RepID=UPI002B23FE0D|nr:stalk domain-containing protein [Lysinibacillus xylanilyticus]MEB2299364.1 copper amine oxidase N-terminal domain-containing protein [Lysinibacillus xylanilyticus]